VYNVGIGSNIAGFYTDRWYESRLMFGSPPRNCWGFEEFRELRNANGKAVSLRMEDWATNKVPSYTLVYFGNAHLTVRMPAWLLGTATVLLLAAASIPTTAALSRTYRHRRHSAEAGG
jgi:hypothetical protein